VSSSIAFCPKEPSPCRLAAEIEDLLSVDRQDRLALHKVLQFLAEPQRMDIAVGRVVAAGALLEMMIGWRTPDRVDRAARPAIARTTL
jgi:hypothetical protein